MKTIWIRNPKCAGTSIYRLFLSKEVITESFCEKSNHHIIKEGKVKQFQDKHIELFNKAWKYAIVRNPWDRIISTFFYAKKKEKQWINEQMTFKQYLRIPFEDMKKMTPIFNGISRLVLHSRPLYDHMANKTGSCDYLNFIGRFENLENDFDIICKKLEVKGSLKHRNKGNHEHYTKYYDEESRTLVANKYADDIKHFNYSFS